MGHLGQQVTPALRSGAGAKGHELIGAQHALVATWDYPPVGAQRIARPARRCLHRAIRVVLVILVRRQHLRAHLTFWLWRLRAKDVDVLKPRGARYDLLIGDAQRTRAEPRRGLRLLGHLERGEVTIAAEQD